MKKGIVFLLLTLTLVFGFNSTKLLRAQEDEKDQKILELQKEIKTFKSELEKLIQENKSINELKERIDLLETKLEKLKIEMQEINPLITDVTKNWGKGFYLGSRIDNYPTTYSAEVGYNFNLQKKKMPWINRLGLVIGFMANQQKIEKEKKSIYIFPFQAFYTKLTLSTPIYINFIGLSLSQKFIYDYSSGDKWYLGGGIDINFWIHRRTCITLGFFGEPRIFQNDNDNAQSDDILGKNQLGIKWFFK